MLNCVTLSEVEGQHPLIDSILKSYPAVTNANIGAEEGKLTRLL